MSATLLQELVVDAVVLAAVAWLVWSFGPESWRRRGGRRRAAPSHDRALQADALDGQPNDGCDCKP